MSFHVIARWMHIAAGVVALGVIWLPLVARKGSPLHRRTGWIYVVAMLVSALSGFVLAGRWLFEDPPSRRPFALFLMYVSVLGAVNATTGVRVLRTKARTGAWNHPLDLGMGALLILAALVVLVQGLVAGMPLLIGFSVLGLFLGTGQLRYWRSSPDDSKQWLFEHMGNMIGSGIGTFTAFFVVNARQLGADGFQLWLWLAPSVVGVTGLTLWRRAWRRKLEAEAAAEVPRAAS